MATVSATVLSVIASLRAAIIGALSASGQITRHALALVVVHKQAPEDVADTIRDAALEAGHTSGPVLVSQFLRICKAGIAAEVYADMEAADSWVSFSQVIRTYNPAKASNKGRKASAKNSGAAADPVADGETAPETVAALVPVFNGFRTRVATLSPDMELADLLNKVNARLVFLAQSEKDGKAK